MPRPVHFEIPADNVERARGFYQKVFGWQFQKWEGPMPYWLVQTGSGSPGIDGGLHTRTFPGQGPVNTIDVASCEECLQRITAEGGAVTVPRMAVPGIGWLAYCTDTEGNSFGIMQSDPGAA
jgi:predicted enzyme related to lactoylglutathione lyase